MQKSYRKCAPKASPRPQNHTENVHQKLVADPCFILLNNPKQPLHARNSFKNKTF